MNYKKIWDHIFFLGIVVTAFGLLLPWWCSGHHSFACTNSLGFTWHTTFNSKLLEPAGFTPSIGILLPILLAVLVWLEIRNPDVANKVRNALVILIFVTCLFAIVSTLQLVRIANHCQSFTAWTTRYIDTIFPMSITCTSSTTWITDVFQGIWITFTGVLILLFMSFVKPLFLATTDEEVEWA